VTARVGHVSAVGAGVLGAGRVRTA
jgi:hypothetical protein